VKIGNRRPRVFKGIRSAQVSQVSQVPQTQLKHPGTLEQDIKTRESRATRALQEKMDEITRFLGNRLGKPGPSAPVNLIAHALQLDYEETKRLLESMERDKRVFQPRPGFYKSAHY
jgi:hypothetical protein